MSSTSQSEMKSIGGSAIRATSCWQPVLFASMAGGMGWGIRGQYGHETGAMIAGVLVSLTLTWLLAPRASSLTLARAVAWGTLGMGIGGSMTYGQTVGLTHDGPLIGNWDALRWGMLGLALKGGIWIGFAGTFLGMGLSKVRYRPKEMLLLMLGLVGVYFFGRYLLNSPFDPASKTLPALYFSDHWFWEPEGGFTPRPECWGGLLTALAVLVAYTGWYRGDRLVRAGAFWGALGGAVGFPAGQSLQAFNAWNREMLGGTWWDQLPMNWWNMMETTFGAIMGAVLGLGFWLNRRHVMPASKEDSQTNDFPLAAEFALLAVHLPMLLAVELMAVPFVDALYDLGLIMVVIPIVATCGGRWWPYLQVLPLTAIPIAGKTIRLLGYDEFAFAGVPNWLIWGVTPIVLATVLAIRSGLTARPDLANSSERGGRSLQAGRSFLRRSLLLTVWLYFSLNYVFFDYPWPWQPWTGRTANGLLFTVCAFGLTVCACFASREPLHSEDDNNAVAQ